MDPGREDASRADDPRARRPLDIRFAAAGVAQLTVDWADGVTAHYPYRALRLVCPCAHCVDELSGERVLDPRNVSEGVTMVDASYVGRYALRIVWSDGHDTGLYAFRFLRWLHEQGAAEDATEKA